MARLFQFSVIFSAAMLLACSADPEDEGNTEAQSPAVAEHKRVIFDKEGVREIYQEGERVFLRDVTALPAAETAVSEVMPSTESAAVEEGSSVVVEVAEANMPSMAAQPMPKPKPPTFAEEPQPEVKPPSTPTPAPATSDAEFGVQVGLFSKRSNAVSLQAKLAKDGLVARIENVTSSKGQQYHLLVIPVRGRRSAAQLIEKQIVADYKLGAFVVRMDSLPH